MGLKAVFSIGWSGKAASAKVIAKELKEERE